MSRSYRLSQIIIGGPRKSGLIGSDNPFVLALIAERSPFPATCLRPRT